MAFEEAVTVTCFLILFSEGDWEALDMVFFFVVYWP